MDSHRTSFYRLPGETDADFCTRIRRVGRLFKRQLLKTGTDDPRETHHKTKLTTEATPNGEQFHYDTEQ